MKRFFLFAFIVLSAHSALFGQNYTKAVITDVVFIRRTSAHVTEKTFPFYFNHKQFVTDVLADISRYTKEKFYVSEVEFNLPDSIHYLSAMDAPKIKLRQKAKKMGGKDKLYASVETILEEGLAYYGIYTYKLITKVTLYTGKGQLYYKFKHIIPFETYATEDIAGMVQMNDQDFQTFYFDGIKSAFEGKKKKAEHRYVAKPAADYYLSFFSKAEKFYLGFNGKEYVYGNDATKLLPVISFSDNPAFSNGREFNFGIIFESAMLKEGFKLKNRIEDKDYLVKLREGTYSFTQHLVHNTIMTVDFLSAEKDTIATFYYDWFKVLTTKIIDSEYKLSWNKTYHCTEIYSCDTLVCLVNELLDKKIIYLHGLISETQLGDIINLLFINDFLLAVKERELSVIYFYSGAN